MRRVSGGDTDCLRDNQSARDRADEWYSYTALCEYGRAAAAISAASSKFLIRRHLFQPLRNVRILVLNSLKVGRWTSL